MARLIDDAQGHLRFPKNKKLTGNKKEYQSCICSAAKLKSPLKSPYICDLKLSVSMEKLNPFFVILLAYISLISSKNI